MAMYTFNNTNYDLFTKELARYPKEQTNPQIVEAMYCALGLTGEAGEAAEKVKKWHRDGVINYQDLAKELGDVLYYLTRLANTVGLTLEEVMDLNVTKLKDRQQRGVLKGSGDNR
jgi:NTP pyrophosphatase (non-canonical NTP hydrolase)